MTLEPRRGYPRCQNSAFLNPLNLAFLVLSGNQRELARAKNQKKQLEIQKKKGACDKSSNAGLTLEQRKHRDAELMREKQRRKQENAGNGGGGGN